MNDWMKNLTSSDSAPTKMTACDAGKTYLGMPLVQKVMCNFGTQYKKSKGFDDLGVHSSPMLPKQGKEESEKLMEELAQFEAQDVAKVLPSFKDMVWLYGCKPQFPRVEALPSAAGQLRLQVMGSLQVILVDPHLVQAAMPPNTGLETAIKTITDLTIEGIEKLQKEGVKFFKTTLAASEVLWMPVGWICCTRADQGSLTYGVRKSYYMIGKSSKKSLEAIASMQKADSKNVTRLEEIIALY